MSKFHSIPLEHQDLLSYAWIAFDELLKVYQTKNIKKKFVWSVIDAVSWKCTDVCAKYINNRHKILNMSLANSNISLEILENIPAETYKEFNYVIFEMVEIYFKKHKNKLAKPVFEMYLDNVPKKQIFTKFNISRNKFKKIIDDTINDLRTIIGPFLD
uniref:Uncharacterized protein n=1 Tax=Mycoplasma feriruminatoris TaxID=1179777 RepID=A0A654IEV6_9MOLU|nr:hypothetical protein MF5294_00743 [Mycoplasma feriruminatoris]